jgi:hypothetical protein
MSDTAADPLEDQHIRWRKNIFIRRRNRFARELTDPLDYMINRFARESKDLLAS